MIDTPTVFPVELWISMLFLESHENCSPYWATINQNFHIFLTSISVVCDRCWLLQCFVKPTAGSNIWLPRCLVCTKSWWALKFFWCARCCRIFLLMNTLGSCSSIMTEEQSLVTLSRVTIQLHHIPISRLDFSHIGRNVHCLFCAWGWQVINDLSLSTSSIKLCQEKKKKLFTVYYCVLQVNTNVDW